MVRIAEVQDDGAIHYRTTSRQWKRLGPAPADGMTLVSQAALVKKKQQKQASAVGQFADPGRMENDDAVKILPLAYLIQCTIPALFA
jgi:hypothetical protein